MLEAIAVRPGGAAAITGAAGALGGYAVQLAKHYGLYVVADAASADEELVKELGADLIVARGDQVAARIRDALPTGVDGVIDAALYNAIAAAGRDGGSITRDAST